METMVLGMLAAVVLIACVCCLCVKKHVLCLSGSVFAIVLTFFTGNSWRQMLADSGKDTALLGFHRYPAAVIILSTVLFLAILCMVISVFCMARNGKRKGIFRR